jgi:ABC-type branched-subunit amino acid transport system ATPase component
MHVDLPSGAEGMPFGWWGPAWAPREQVALRELIRSGLVPLDLAALLWALIDRGASVLVAAGPSGAGKTTLLTGLLELLDPAKRRFHARGMHETFAEVEQADPAGAAILVNEISPHLPVYLWGEPARRLFALARNGFQFFATCHAETVEEVVYGFCSSSLRLRPSDLAAIDGLIFLKAWRDGPTVRREIQRVVALRGDDRAGLEALPLFAQREINIAGVARAFQLGEHQLPEFLADHERRTAELWARINE